MVQHARTAPFSHHFGFERGTPIDRYYMDLFLRRWSADITGVVLEIQTGDTARRYGQAIERIDTIDIDGAHDPTYRCDLAASGGIVPDAQYDCFLMPSTLPFLRNMDDALVNPARPQARRSSMATTPSSVRAIPAQGLLAATVDGCERIARASACAAVMV